MLDQMRRDRDRPHARPTAAVRDAEGLVQVEMTDIHPEISRAAEAHLRGKIRAIHIDLTAARMDDFGRLDNRFLKHAVGGGIGDHRAGKVGLVQVGLGAQVGHVDVALGIARDRHDPHARHHRAGGIRPVRGNRNQADAPVRFPARTVVAADGQETGRTRPANPHSAAARRPPCR